MSVVVLMSPEVVASREHRLFVSSGSCGGLIVMYSSEAPVDDSPARGLSGLTVRPVYTVYLIYRWMCRWDGP